MRLSNLTAAAVVALLLPLAGCVAPSGEPAASTPSLPAAQTSESTAITIEIDGQTITGSLSDNAAARSLLEQLPLTLSFSDHAGQEKTAKLPSALSLENEPAGDDAEPAVIGYYAPDQVLVFYYENVGYFRGIVRLGSFDNLEAIRGRTGTFTATVAAQ